MITIRYTFIGLLLVPLIGQLSAAPVSGDDDNDATVASIPSSSSSKPAVPEISTSPFDLIMTDSAASAAGQQASKLSNRFAETIKNIQTRIEKSRQILTEIVDSFISNPDDGSKLEEALAQYDEIVEDIEADFTKAKIEFGLRMEGNVDKANKTLEQMERQLNDLNTQFINWSTINRARMTTQLKQGLIQFNDFLSSGVEMFLEVSEKGKDMLRGLQRRRLDAQQSTLQSTYEQPKKSGFFIPFLGQL